MKTVLYYSFFAFLATIVNIGSQDITVRLYSGQFKITLSIFIGTATGLIVKYILDKKYIFKFQPKNISQDSRTFLIYTFMGVFTTVIFWGFEYFFEYLFHDDKLRYTGGIIGLAIGYWLKYHMDKRFVFK
jgi:hypothetical protein